MRRSYAIVPAAGSSARMGVPKLLLPLAGRPLIDHVLTAWLGSTVTRTVVVVRRGDDDLADRCRAFDVDLVVAPCPPRDMRASVELGLACIAARYAPADDDVWLLAPADVPLLSSAMIDRVLAEMDATPGAVVAPTFAGRRGHPTGFPWAVADRVSALAPDEGVNALLARCPVREFKGTSADVLSDVDSPADYARLAAEWRETTQSRAVF